VPDGLPLPGPRLIFLVIGTPWSGVYLRSGREVTDAMQRHLAACGVHPRSFRSVLDFGCGCGRLLRHVRGFTQARLHGCDYNPELVGWCASQFPWGSFAVNRLAPPLAYEDGSMDFVYARSVFTHLDAPLQTAWMRELLRVLAPGGVLYFTTHGETVSGGLGEGERRDFREGRLVVVRSEVEGTNLCAAFHPAGYVRRELLEGFRLLLHVEGGGGAHDRQDVWLVRKAPPA
jgi:SAM-dependent methyltransferase